MLSSGRSDPTSDRAGFPVKTLRLAANIPASQLRDVGFPVQALRAGGCTAEELKESGCGAQELYKGGECSKPPTCDPWPHSIPVEGTRSKSRLSQATACASCAR